MGTWGAGLYADDYALDLRTSIGAVCRLPYTGDQIVELLAELNEAGDPNDETYTTFWLVVADQLHRRGIVSPARQRALDIIADGTNLAVLAKLGMAEANLEKRRQALKALGDELRSPTEGKTRKTLKKPQELLFSAGDVLADPVDIRRNCCNPYLPESARARFQPVSWDGCVVVASGRALDYLAWYQVAPTRDSWKNRPTLADVAAGVDLGKVQVGTLSKSHLVRIGLELLGTSVPPKVGAPPKRLLISTAASDISVANILSRGLNPRPPT